MRFVPVEHDANQTDSPEEVEKVAELVELLFGDDATWVDKESKARRIALDDILIVAPYNAQVSRLLRKLRLGLASEMLISFRDRRHP